MIECSRCGECCRLFILARSVISLTPRVREYLQARGVSIDRGFLLVYAPCPHLIEHEDGTTSCGIQEIKPAICRDGPLGGDINYLPKGCSFRKKDR
jgi:Fe-S-cluster containining protein